MRDIDPYLSKSFPIQRLIRNFAMQDKLINDRPLQALVIGFFVYFCFNTSRVTTGIYIAFNQHSPVQLGLAMALYSIAPVFLAVRIGEMASRLGPGAILLRGCSVFLIGLGVQSLTNSIVFIFLGAFITGAAFTALQIALQLHIGESSGPQFRIRNFGYFSMAQSVANSSAAIIAGFTSSQFGLHVPFVVNVGISLLCAVFVYKGRFDFRFSPKSRSTTVYHSESIIQLIIRREVLMTLVAGAFLAMAWDLHSFIVPFVSDASGLNPQKVGIVFGMFSASTFIIRIALPSISKFTSSATVVKASLVAVGLCFLLYPWWISYASLSIFAVILGLALGTAQPSLLDLLHNIVPEKDLGRIVGFRTVLLNLGATIWPLLFGMGGAHTFVILLVSVGALILMVGLVFPTFNKQGRTTVD